MNASVSNPKIRTLTDHQVGPLDQHLLVQSVDEEGPGGAHHDYVISRTESLVGGFLEGDPASTVLTTIHFQKGPIQENGVNGISIEALLTVAIDRLRCFQAGPYACEANGLALAKLESALGDLQDRTRDRLARHVEGTSAK